MVKKFELFDINEFADSVTVNDSITEDDINRYGGTINWTKINNIEDFNKAVRSYQGMDFSGGVTLPFDFYDALKKKWENEILPKVLQKEERERFEQEEKLRFGGGTVRRIKARQRIKGIPKVRKIPLKRIHRERARIKALFNIYKSELRGETPEKKRVTRRIEKNKKVKYELKFKGRWTNFDKISRVSGYKYERGNKTIIIKPHFRRRK